MELEKYMRTRKSRERAVNKLLDQYYFDKIMEGGLDLTKFIAENEIEDIRSYIKTRAKRRYKYIMITVNPMEDTPVYMLSKKIIKCISKKWIKNAMYCHEWRDKEIGLHCHIRCEIDDKNPCEINRECFNTFKNLVGNKLHVNIKMSNANKAFQNYVMGLKDGKPKPNHKYDKVNRLKYELEDWYIYTRDPTSE